MHLLSALSPSAIVRQLRQGKDASTFERLGRSRHAVDLFVHCDRDDHRDAIRFLKAQFKDDLRHPLLLARELTYRQDVPALRDIVAAGIGPQWNRAKDIMVELTKRYSLACPSPVTA